MIWRARSASDRTDNWPFWYLTDDQPPNRNKTAEAFEIITGRKWPPIHQFLDREAAIQLAEQLAALPKETDTP